MKSHGIWHITRWIWTTTGFFLILGSFNSHHAFAEVDEEYRFDWLDPDKKIYVLQNRKYRKARKLLLSGALGLGLSDPYRTTYTFDPRIAYYISENWAVEAFYTFSMSNENSTFDALVNASPSTLPVIRKVNSQIGLLAQWSPWYAKINVFNSILYFDWYFAAGLGLLRTEIDTRASATDPNNFVSQDRLGFFIGTGHQYHLSEGTIFKIDFTGAFYQAPVFGNSGGNTWFSNFNITFGIGARL